MKFPLAFLGVVLICFVSRVVSPQDQSASPEIVLAWNNLALDVVRASKQGPTISGRFCALLNTALYSTWASFQEDSRGWIIDVDAQSVLGGRSPKKETVLRAMALAARDVFINVATTLLTVPPKDSRISAIGNPARIPEFVSRANTLAQESTNKKVEEDKAQTIATLVSEAIIEFALSDNSNQTGFYDENEYTLAETVFDPTAAAAGEFTRVDSSWQSLPSWNILPSGASAWPMSPQWGSVKPFALLSGSELRPDSVLTPYKDEAKGIFNQEFVDQAVQVVELAEAMQTGKPGSALQRAKSEFWELGDNTPFPPGWWLLKTLELIETRNINLKLALKLAFAVSQAVFDAGVSAWEAKYFFNTARPFAFINHYYFGQEVPDWRGTQIATFDTRAGWRPYQLRRNYTPRFPDIPSGHSAFSMAAAVVIRTLLGTNVFDAGETFQDLDSRFDLNGFDGLPGAGEDISFGWKYLTQAAEEAGISRLFGGIHMMEGNYQGLLMGIRAGNLAVAKAQALFGGGLGEREEFEDQLPITEIGTMSADTLHSRSRSPTLSQRPIHVYGLLGADTLFCDDQAVVELFGGDDMDTYVIKRSSYSNAGASSRSCAIRDYQAGEVISFRGGAGWESNQLSIDISAGYTVFSMGDEIVLTLDGEWGEQDLNIHFGN